MSDKRLTCTTWNSTFLPFSRYNRCKMNAKTLRTIFAGHYRMPPFEIISKNWLQLSQSYCTTISSGFSQPPPITRHELDSATIGHVIYICVSAKREWRPGGINCFPWIHWLHCVAVRMLAHLPLRLTYPRYVAGIVSLRRGEYGVDISISAWVGVQRFCLHLAGRECRWRCNCKVDYVTSRVSLAGNPRGTRASLKQSVQKGFHFKMPWQSQIRIGEHTRGHFRGSDHFVARRGLGVYTTTFWRDAFANGPAIPFSRRLRSG